jgi:hypothetical protein
MLCLTCEDLCQEKRSDLKKEMLDLKKRSEIYEEKGKICKLYALIKVRIVKIFRSKNFVLCRSKISEIVLFLKHGSRYV